MRRVRPPLTLLGLALISAAATACSSEAGSSAQTSTSATAAQGSVSAAASSLPEPEAAPRAKANVREGGALALAVGEQALYLADEDHKALRRIPLPSASAVPSADQVQTLELPGAPAQVLALAGRVLVTVRDPGLLLVIERDEQGALFEKGRVELPADAWGVGLSADESIVLVSSAWTSQISAVELGSLQKLWSLEVAREPRAVVLNEQGTVAYVSHLVGSALTKLEAAGPGGLASPPKVSSVGLTPAPLRSPSGVTLGASLGYAALLSPDQSRLFVARHALGALGENAWFGASTVDVLLTADDSSLAPRRHNLLPFLRADKAPSGRELVVPGKPLSPFTQPRAMAYRKSTQTLLVASEGDDLLAELDATGLDPARGVLRSYVVGSDYDPLLPVAGTCGAPSGLALSSDEKTAWVWCRSTYDLAVVKLEDFSRESAPAKELPAAVVSTVRLAEEPLADKDGAIGRRLFYNATDRITSGGLACAGCHPEGRDDGHVWHEAKFNTTDGTHTNFVGDAADIPQEEGVRGLPRRTPMLAGLVAAAGPYGWHGESPDLAARLNAGFGLHRWGGMPKHDGSNLIARAGRLTVFLRRGLVPPPALGRELSETEKRGRDVFASPEVRCAQCHAAETGFTNRAVYSLAKLPVRGGFDEEEEAGFKTPSLRFIGGRAPYFHDGRAPSLEWIINNNNDRMGSTNQLSGVDRAALVAYLKTL